ncbi:MAG: hypothetical protein P4K86_08585 [Terracidiphilus sp.]|nr:hypothetical protein [Terracidiphilus sp.]MDR3775721.1 hypothetical protein [Terracidiphilus sp.]
MKMNAAHNKKPQNIDRIRLKPVKHGIRRGAEMVNLNSLLTVSS